MLPSSSLESRLSCDGKGAVASLLYNTEST